MYTHEHTHVHTHKKVHKNVQSSLFINSSKSKNHKYSLIIELLNKLQYNHIMEHYSAIQGNKLLVRATK